MRNPVLKPYAHEPAAGLAFVVFPVIPSVKLQRGTQ